MKLKCKYFQYFFQILVTPASAAITAELEAGTKVEFDKDGKSKIQYDFETKITKIKITAEGYEHGTLDDHTLAAEVTGDENKKTITLTKKKV